MEIASEILFEEEKTIVQYNAKGIGYHIIADLYGVEFDLIDKEKDIKILLENSVLISNLTKINSYYYQFNPHGATGIVLLAESHISIHTWPEYNLVTLDIYTCGDTSKAEIAYDYIIKTLQPKHIFEKRFERGLL